MVPVIRSASAPGVRMPGAGPDRPGWTGSLLHPASDCRTSKRSPAQPRRDFCSLPGRARSAAVSAAAVGPSLQAFRRPGRSPPTGGVAPPGDCRGVRFFQGGEHGAPARQIRPAESGEGSPLAARSSSRDAVHPGHHQRRRTPTERPQNAPLRGRLCAESGTWGLLLLSRAGPGAGQARYRAGPRGWRILDLKAACNRNPNAATLRAVGSRVSCRSTSARPREASARRRCTSSLSRSRRATWGLWSR